MAQDTVLTLLGALLAYAGIFCLVGAAIGFIVARDNHLNALSGAVRGGRYGLVYAFTFVALLTTILGAI